MLENFFPFKLDNDPTTQFWEVYLEHPTDENNFIVVYKSKSFEECATIRESLNNLMQKNTEKLFNDYERRNLTDDNLG
jgi:hypothetical protein